MNRIFGGIWPKSLKGQLLLAVALALLLAAVPRQVAGAYLAGLPLHSQLTLLVLASKVGVSVTTTSRPTEVLAVEP